MITQDNNYYNRFVNLDGITYRIIDFLAKSGSKYADNLWKILKYDTEDCLSLPSLTYQERMSLLYTNNGDASVKRVFMTPYIDDAWEEQSAHLHIYIHSIEAKDHISSSVNVAFQCIVHNKIANIVGDADILNEDANPSELDKDGNPIIIYKTRDTVMLKSVLADINGAFVAGVGNLQFNKKLSEINGAKSSLWNARKFFGHEIIMSTLLSGASNNNNCGW